jgi:hypothetical protein
MLLTATAQGRDPACGQQRKAAYRNERLSLVASIEKWI